MQLLFSKNNLKPLEVSILCFVQIIDTLYKLLLLTKKKRNTHHGYASLLGQDNGVGCTKFKTILNQFFK